MLEGLKMNLVITERSLEYRGKRMHLTVPHQTPSVNLKGNHLHLLIAKTQAGGNLVERIQIAS